MPLDPASCIPGFILKIKNVQSAYAALFREKKIFDEEYRIASKNGDWIWIHDRAVSTIFRFLTKPCEIELLKKVITTCLVQYRLVLAEKELLENTLMGSIKMLTDILCIANPPAFSRALRIRRYVKHITHARHLEPEWQFEVAAMLSQIGSVTLTSEVVEAAHQGQSLNEVDQKAFDQHPEFAGKLLANIPRLEGIAWIVAHQRATSPIGEGQMPANIREGAAVLRAAVAFDDLTMRGMTHPNVLEALSQNVILDQRAVQSLATLPTDTANTALCVSKIWQRA